MKKRDGMTKVWDPIVRIGHWTLVVAFFTAYFTEDDFLTQHVYAGYVVGVVVCMRVLWGFVGSKHARFNDFVCSPIVTLRYISDLMRSRAKRFIGHNPAGGAMVIALLLAITGTTISGLMLYAIEEGEGPLAGWVAEAPASSAAPLLVAKAYADDDRDKRPGVNKRKQKASEEFWEETHEILANLTLLLVGLHIAGVLFSSYAHRENLVKSMFTGRKPGAL
ncbi:MAG: cytochrome b/b6 domain-containing protein [Halioglobus sp.]